VFASPGDSGSVITDVAQNNGLGLVVARGYGFDTLNNFTTYFILICPLPAVAQGLADVMNQDLRPNPPLTGGDLKFYVDL
jgi:hypothetical protein